MARTKEKEPKRKITHSMERKAWHTVKDVEEVKMSENLRKIGNAFYLEMKANHVGKENTICGDAIAQVISDKLNINVNKTHIWRVAKLLVRKNKLSVCSWVKGYYVDDSYGALRDTLRFLLTNLVAIRQSVFDLREVIEQKYGNNILPGDIDEMIAQFEEEDAEDE